MVSGPQLTTTGGAVSCQSVALTQRFTRRRSKARRQNRGPWPKERLVPETV